MIIIISVIIIYYSKKQKTFLMKNKELSDKLLLINDLNNIPFNTIKFDKKEGSKLIIGHGATSIVNLILKFIRYIQENIMEN
jgi:hypothetical protein